MQTLNIKTNYKHCALEYRIKKADPSQDMSRSAVFEREVKAAKGVNNWKAVQATLSDLKIEEEAVVFTGLQVHYEDETERILSQVKKDICEQCGLQILQTQYMLQLLQANYLETLKREKLFLKTESMVDGSQIGLPEMASILVEMMLKDKDCDHLKQVREILVDWRNK